MQATRPMVGRVCPDAGANGFARSYFCSTLPPYTVALRPFNFAGVLKSAPKNSGYSICGSQKSIA